MNMKRREFLKISSMMPVLSMINPIGYKIASEALNNQRITEPLKIGTKKQLLLYEKLIQSTKNIKLNMNSPYQDNQLLLTADQPWELKGEGRGVNAHNCIMKEDQKFRLWYDLMIGEEQPDYPTERCMGYAESEDGVHFSKPKFPINSLYGYNKTNILLKVSRGGSVWIDPNETGDKHYKHQCKGPEGRLYFFSSPDGIHWESTHDVDIGDCDTQNIAFWDQSLQQYVLYTREWIRRGDQSKLSERRKNNYRVHRRLTSQNLKHWNKGERVLEPNDTDFKKYNLPNGYTKPPVDYYSGLVFKYPNEQGIYIMLASAFWHWMDEDSKYEGNLLGPQSMDIRLAVSYDGVNFRRVSNWRPFLRNGPEGSWSSRMLWANPWPLQVNDELWFYYWGSNCDHAGHRDSSANEDKNGIGRAILRLDGFVSADAEYSRGELLTQPLKFQGEILKLNVDTSAGGSVFVEMLDNQGNPIQGFTKNDCIPVVGNSVSMPVRWKGGNNLRELNNKPVQLRFCMKDSKLYAFQFSF